MFSLDKEQNKKLVEFMRHVEKIYRNQHGLSEDEEIYLGSIGGGMTYSFTPTSIGCVVKVEYLGHEIDLSDYDSW